MSTHWVGAIDLLLAFAPVFAWGAWELYSLRRDKRKRDGDKSSLS